jgi:hypothetical protein
VLQNKRRTIRRGTPVNESRHPFSCILINVMYHCGPKGSFTSTDSSILADAMTKLSSGPPGIAPPTLHTGQDRKFAKTKQHHKSGNHFLKLTDVSIT